MNRLRVVPIVEGHGEEASVRPLLQRIWLELLHGEYIEVLRPIRLGRGRILQPAELSKAVQLAVRKLAVPSLVPDPSLVFILVDADEQCPAELAPSLLAVRDQVYPRPDLACVVAKVEFETWFVAAAASLSEYLEMLPTESSPASPEEARCGKGWIQRRFRGAKYSETIDQPAMTAKMDLGQCRAKCPSFDKLCRELELRLARP